MPGKYGTPAVFGDKLHPDEPWFAVRAQDLLAPLAIASYVRAARRLGLHELGDHVEQLGIATLRWQAEHPDLVKAPD